MFYIVKTDLEGNYTYCNQEFLEKFSHCFPQNKVIGTKGMESIHKDDHAKVLDTIQKCLQNPNKSYSITVRKPVSETEYTYSDWDFICLTNSEGKPTEFLCSGMDTTLRKKLETSVQELNTLTKTMADSAESFYQRDNLSEILKENFSKIGKILPIDRMHYFERVNNKKFIFSQRAEWCSPGTKALQNSKIWQNLTLRENSNLIKILNSRNVYNEKVKNIQHDDLKELLLAHKIRSLLIIPIFLDDTLFGLIGFACCRESRIWEESEITILKILSYHISSFLKRKQMEEALQALEENLKSRVKELYDYRFALDSYAIVAVTDLNGVITYANDKFVQISGYTREEIIGKTHKIVNSGYHNKTFFTNLWKTISSGNIWRGEIRNRSKNGTNYWVDTTIVPFLDESGKPYQYLAIRYEITQKKIIEDKIQENEKKLRLITENASTYILELDTNGKILFANRMLPGMYIENVVGSSYEEWISDDQKIIARRYLEDAIENKIEKEYEIMGAGEYGEIRWYLTRLSPIVQDDIVKSIILVSNDITERKAFEESLRKAKSEAEKANRVKSEFLANMSHEIRTPLNGVLGFTELLRSTPLNPIQAEYVKNINTSAHILMKIINDILDFSKIEAQKLDLEIIKTDLMNLLEQVIDIQKYHADKKSLELLLSTNLPLPKYVMVDEIRLKQVLTNLLGNALKFTEEGEIELNVQFEYKDDRNGLLAFSVRDTGIGIRPEQKEKLFKAFSQADSSTTRKYGGTGLGLAISSLLVEKMNGKIQLQSEYGVGSTFYFQIPVTYEIEVTEKLSSSIKKVLVIDNNKTNRKILKNILSYWTIDTITCENALIAMDILSKKSDFDFIIIDNQLPIINGIETIRKIRCELNISKNNCSIILMHNSINEPPSREEMLNLGIKGYLVKPVKFNHLQKLLFKNEETTEDRSPISNNQKDLIVNTEPLQILIADDVEMNLLLVHTILEGLVPNANIIEARDGLTAWNYAKSFSFDLILLDILMPEMDGIQVARKIRELEISTGHRTPIIALTAAAVLGEKEKCIEAGIDDFLTKPIEISQFRQLLEKWLRQDFNPILTVAFPKEGVLNLRVMSEFVGEDRKIQRKFLEKFQSISESKFNNFLQNFTKLSLAEVKDFCHKMRPSLRTIGAMNMYNLLDKIEKQASRGNIYPENQVILETELQKLLKAIEFELQ